VSFDLALLLFVPGDRPDRFAKALASGASGAILDLEDAVALDAKDAARERVRAFLDEAEDLSRVAVRINACDSEAGARDLAMLAGARRVGAVLVPKVEDTEDLAAVGAALGDVPQIALLETARGIVAATPSRARPD
jgi:citrate lyase subunit beta/citryl-CoA lyase